MPQSNIHSALEKFCDKLSANPRVQCPKCGCIVMHMDCTFFTTGPSGRIWAVPQPICPKCDLRDDTAKFVPTAEC